MFKTETDWPVFQFAMGLLLGVMSPPLLAQCELAKLTAGDTGYDQRFGTSLCLRGDAAVIGAPYDSEVAEEAGAAYVLRRQDNGTPDDPADDFWVEEAKLTASDAAADERFGIAVAIHGDRIVVGADLDDHAGSLSGAAYVFRRDGATWVEEAKLTASDADSLEQFGRAVAIQGDVILIGKPHVRSDPPQPPGSVYVFCREGTEWVEQAKLTASDAPDGAGLGVSLAFSGDLAIAGACDAFPGGAVYVFRREGDGWVQEAKLTQSDATGGDRFGWSLCLAGDCLVVGAYLNTAGATQCGSAYVFRRERGEWIQEAKLTAFDRHGLDHFGFSVAIRADQVVVGAPDHDNAAGTDAGAAYAFRRDGSEWVPGCKLTPHDRARWDGFGCSLSMAEDWALIGSCYDSHAGGADAGSAYVYLVGGEDADDDGVPDLCDACPGFDDRFDADDDGMPDDCDICPGYNDYIDSDGDGVPDACDDEQCELQKLTGGEGSGSAEFGYSVSIHGDWAAVGAYDDVPSGSAYIFRRFGATWDREARLVSSDGQINDELGSAISLDDDVVVVGDRANGFYSDTGAAYVFVHDGDEWTECAKLVASDGSWGDKLGASVSLDDDLIVAGAPGRAEGGSAYVFRQEAGGWVQEARLDAANAERFGRSVCVNQGWVVVGAPDTATGVGESGAAYVFQHDGAAWVEQAQLVASDAETGDDFGYSVSISAARIVVGACSDELAPAFAPGSAYVFRREGDLWVEEAKLIAPDPADGDLFGYSVSISGDRIVVGAWHDTDNGWRSGSAYVFRREGTTWITEAKLTASDGVQKDWFGYSVSISGDRVLVSAHKDDHEDGIDAGSAYLFSVGGDDCNANGAPDLCDIASGFSEDINGNGVPDECECVADLDGDGDVDQADLGILLGDWGCVGDNCAGDIDCDGDTDQADLGILLADWGCTP